MAEHKDCSGLVRSLRSVGDSPGVEGGCQVRAGLEELPRWSSWSYKQSGSNWIDPSVRISLSTEEKKEIMQEIYEPYMGRGEEDRKSYEIVRGSRRRQTSGTVSVMVDRMERGNGKDRDDGDISKQVDVRVKKF